MRTPTIDLNADLGEEVTDDAALLAVVTSANVACGYHAGIGRDHARGLRGGGPARRLGRRPGLLRRPRRTSAGSPGTCAYAVLREQVADQVGTLSEIAAAAGTTVRYLKPHGALYHRVLDDEEQARAVLDGSGDGCRCSGCRGGCSTLAAAAGRAVFHEGFPDRGYTAGRPAGAALGARGAGRATQDAIVAQALALAGDASTRCACTATARERSSTPSPYDVRWLRSGSTLRPFG